MEFVYILDSFKIPNIFFFCVFSGKLPAQRVPEFTSKLPAIGPSIGEAKTFCSYVTTELTERVFEFNGQGIECVEGTDFNLY
jgi:hypothetical protein